jgi:hypothetical protein
VVLITRQAGSAQYVAFRSPNLYTYGNNDPLNQIDLFGLRPGDPYPTASAAAVDALLDVYAISRSTNLEYAGRIYQDPNGTFSYTPGLTFSQGDPSIPNRNCCATYSSPGGVPSRITHQQKGCEDFVFFAWTIERIPTVHSTSEPPGISR